MRLDLEPVGRGVQVVEAFVCDKNSTTKKIVLPLRVRPEFWNDAAGTVEMPTAQWL